MPVLPATAGVLCLSLSWAFCSGGHMSIRSEIEFTQKLVALVRDIVLIVVTLLTVLIVYFGGNPAKLSAIDWTILVGATFLIIIAPIVAFFIWKLVAFSTYMLVRFLYTASRLYYLSLTDPDVLLDGSTSWFFLQVLRIPERKYISMIEEIKISHKELSQKYTIIYKVALVSQTILLSALGLLIKYYSFRRKIDPWIVAALASVATIWVFYTVLKTYTLNPNLPFIW
jgi:hypothetical protein